MLAMCGCGAMTNSMAAPVGLGGGHPLLSKGFIVRIALSRNVLFMYSIDAICVCGYHSSAFRESLICFPPY